MSEPPGRLPLTLSRWSRRKHAERRGSTPAEADDRAPVVAAGPAGPAADPATSKADATPPAKADAPAPAGVEAPAPVALPDVDSLTFDADFSAFLQPKVDESVKRAALKKLFSDPRFNVMDGLDVYIDDYSKPDPLPPGMLERLVSARIALDRPVAPDDDRRANDGPHVAAAAVPATAGGAPDPTGVQSDGPAPRGAVTDARGTPAAPGPADPIDDGGDEPHGR